MEQEFIGGVRKTETVKYQFTLAPSALELIAVPEEGRSEAARKIFIILKHVSLADQLLQQNNVFAEQAHDKP